MMITQHTLLAALRRILSRTPYISDFRKASDGRILRFVDWRGAAWKREKLTADKSSAVGNAAAMREALANLVDVIDRCDSGSPLWWHCGTKGVIPLKNAKAALAAPPHEAKWTANGGYEFACCSSCGHLQYAGWDSRAEQAEKIGDFLELYKFCPNCGAQMKGAVDGSK